MSRSETFQAIWAAIGEANQSDVWVGVVTNATPANSGPGSKPMCLVRVNGITTGDVPLSGISASLLAEIKAGTARGQWVVGLSNAGQYIGLSTFVIGAQ